MTHRLLAVPAVLVLLLSSSACGADDAGTASGSCTFTIVFEGRGYDGPGLPGLASKDEGATGQAEPGERIGTARDAVCDDTPGDGPDGAETDRTSYAVYRVVGEDPAQVIWAEPIPATTGPYLLTREDPSVR